MSAQPGNNNEPGFSGGLSGAPRLVEIAVKRAILSAAGLKKYWEV